MSRPLLGDWRDFHVLDTQSFAEFREAISLKENDSESIALRPCQSLCKLAGVRTTLECYDWMSHWLPCPFHGDLRLGAARCFNTVRLRY
jgi:hypothetical protein